jgi:hypothetical protein
MVYPSDLRIRSKADALKFYDCVKACHIIPYNDTYELRIEPNRCFSVISKQAIADGTAWMHPSTYDEDGTLAYNYRKYINADLRIEE